MKKIKTLLSIAMLISSAMVFAQNDNVSPIKKSRLAPNIIAFSPVILSYYDREGGMGLSYERMLGKDGILSFYGNFYSIFYNYGGFRRAFDIEPSYYVSPGLKLYPWGYNGKIKYAFGPSLVARIQAIQEYEYPSFRFTTRNELALGALINNSINFSPTAHIYTGFEAGIGWLSAKALGGYNPAWQEYVVQLSLKIGYRY